MGGITNTHNSGYLRKSSLGLDEQRVEKILCTLSYILIKGEVS